ncbi:hypothetical protein [Streptomyces sp. NPDC001774]
MSAQSEHPYEPPRLPCTQDAVAAALPPAHRMEFYRDMGHAGPDEIGGVLKNWWLLAMTSKDPEHQRRRAAESAAFKAGTFEGTPAGETLRRAMEARGL